MKYLLPLLLISQASGGIVFVGAGDESSFQTSVSAPGAAMDWIIQPDAVLTGLNVSGRVGDTFTFQAPIVGSVQTQTDWQANRGVVNVLDSDVSFTGLSATNTYTSINDGNHQHQSSTVLNVQRSVVSFTDSTFTGDGKSTVWINSGSVVDFDTVDVHGHYFTAGVIGSDFTALGSTFHSLHPNEAGDKHASIWVGSAMTDLGVDYANTNLLFDSSVFEMTTGTAIVAGNGNSLSERALVTLNDTILDFSTNLGIRPVGVLDAHNNYFGITVNMTGEYDTTDGILAGPLPATDYGWLVNSRGAIDNLLSPLTVCFDGQNCVGLPIGTAHAIPEPSSFAFLGVLLFGFFICRWNKPDE